jgi:hypothetical protein
MTTADAAQAPIASDASVRAVDVSRESRAARWIRLGARLDVVIAIGFVVLSVNLAIESIDPNTYSYRVPELRSLVLVCVVAAGVRAAISFGLEAEMAYCCRGWGDLWISKLDERKRRLRRHQSSS